METIGYVGLIVAAWLIGAIPWGVVLGRIFLGIDVRQYGSKSTGATNALRVLGRKYSLAVFVLDFAKGLIPVLVARWIDAPGWVVGAVGAVAVIGHCWSPYIGFKGGKGMATGGGAAVGMLPWLFFILLPMIGVVALTRYVSLASILGTIGGAIFVVLYAIFGSFSGWWAAGIVVIAAIILYQHRSNIQRLLSGTERKFGVRESTT